MTEQKKLEKLLFECYTEMYDNSTPKADFSQLVEKYKGTDYQFFNDHTIDEDVFEEILEKYVKRIKLAYLQRKFKVSVCLGVAPKFKR